MFTAIIVAIVSQSSHAKNKVPMVCLLNLVQSVYFLHQ